MKNNNIKISYDESCTIEYALKFYRDNANFKEPIKAKKRIDNIISITAEEKELIKSGRSIQRETSQIQGFICLSNRLNICLEGHCDKSDGQKCKTCALLEQYNLA